MRNDSGVPTQSGKQLILVLIAGLILGACCTKTEKSELKEPVKETNVTKYLIESKAFQNREEITKDTKKAIKDLFKNIKGKQINNSDILIVPPLEQDKVYSLIEHKHFNLTGYTRAITYDDYPIRFPFSEDTFTPLPVRFPSDGTFAPLEDNSIEIILKFKETDTPYNMLLDIETNAKGSYHCDSYKGEGIEYNEEDFIIIPFKSGDKRFGIIIFQIYQILKRNSEEDLIAEK